MDHCACKFATIALTSLCAACAGPGARREQTLHDTYASLSRAAGAGAAERAPRELAMAREKAALAQRYLASGEDRIGQWLLEHARADADLVATKAELLPRADR